MTGGRAPASADEVVLGEETLAAVGAGIGDQVEVKAEGGRATMTVVGTALFNDRAEEKTDLDSGAFITLDGARALGSAPFVRQFVVVYAEGVDEEEAFRSLQADFGRTVLRPVPAADVESLRRVGGLPVALATVVGTLALAALAHALMTTVRRQRRDLAVLRALGFLRRQLGTAVLAFAATTVVLAIVVGGPLGIALGRWSWRLVADSLGTPAEPVVPVAVVALVLPVTLLVAAAAAILPARSAAATEPATVLRSE
jgi:ABC-type lipoprotein release transport system permease subunit